jgi:hypothetical protein
MRVVAAVAILVARQACWPFGVLFASHLHADFRKRDPDNAGSGIRLCENRVPKRADHIPRRDIRSKSVRHRTGAALAKAQRAAQRLWVPQRADRESRE